MDILIVGGSSFVGRHITEAAVAADHRVMLANRGRTTTATFGAERLLRIDRDTADLEALRGHTFDAVVDVSAYWPAAVAELHEVLRDSGHHLLVSTISVYDPTGLPQHHDELAPLRPAVHDPAERGRELYGELKVACEEVAADRWGDDLAIVRPGIVAGPHDHTDRFTWWTRHLAEDEHLTLPLHDPSDASGSVQVVDARDLAAFVLRLVEERVAGIFDATGESHRLEDFVAAVGTGVGASPDVRWVDVEELEPDTLPPLVLHPSWGQAGLFDRTSSAALATGLVRRPVSETARDTRAWDLRRGRPDLVT